MRIFYNTKAFERIGSSESDCGIFIGKEAAFHGSQHLLTELKIKEKYRYERFMQQLYTENQALFRILGKDVSFMCNKFLVMTFDFFNYNSIGNYLAVIDILDEVLPSCRKGSANDPLEVHLPNDKEMADVIARCLKRHKIHNYSFIYHEKRRKISLRVLRKLLRLRLFGRYLLKPFAKKRDPEKRIAFLEPITTPMDIYASFKEECKSGETIAYEIKNEMLRPRNLLLIARQAVRKEHLHYSSFYTMQHFRDMKRIHSSIRASFHRARIPEVVFKGIDITKPAKEFLEVMVETYYLLLIDALLISEKICLAYEKVFFTLLDDPMTSALCIDRNPHCKKYAVQYELIYPGCGYNSVERTDLRIEKEFVWNRYSRDVLVERYHYPPSKVEVMGNVRFPKVKKKKHDTVNVVFISQTSTFIEVADTFIQAAKRCRNKKLRFFVKVRADDDNIPDIRHRLEKSNITLLEGAMKDCLPLTDVLVTYASTASYEALYNNIPIVIINPYSSEPLGVPFYEHCPYFTGTASLVKFFDSLTPASLRKKNIPAQLLIPEFNWKRAKEILR